MSDDLSTSDAVWHFEITDDDDGNIGLQISRQRQKEDGSPMRGVWAVLSYIDGDQLASALSQAGLLPE